MQAADLTGADVRGIQSVLIFGGLPLLSHKYPQDTAPRKTGTEQQPVTRSGFGFFQQPFLCGSQVGKNASIHAAVACHQSPHRPGSN
jgi:hypothetical protein